MSSLQLVDFWAQEQRVHKGDPEGSLNGLQPRAEKALVEARSALEAARTAKGKAAEAAAEAQRKMAALRAKMVTDWPASASADASDLRTRIGELRVATGRIALFSDLVQKAEAAVTRATVERERSVARAAEAAAGLEAAKARQKILTGWVKETDPTLIRPSLAAVSAAATAKLASPEKTKAEDKLALYFPPGTKIQQSVDARLTLLDNATVVVATFRKDAGDALAAQLAQPTSGLDGKVEAARIAYEAAWTAFATHARTAEEELARAAALYDNAGALLEPPVELVDSIKAGKLHDDAAAVLTGAEGARNTAFGKLVTAIEDFEKAALQAGSADPVALDPGVVAKYDALIAAQKDLFLATAALRPTGTNAVDLWNAAMPDDAFRAYVAVREATAILTRLSADAQPLLDALLAAEDAFAKALAERAAARRVEAFLRDAVAQRDDWIARIETARQDHLFGAARGDG